MKPLQEKAYERLMTMIINDELDHGVVYSEAKVAEDMGMSRTPVRAALQRLTQDKYIDILPSRGFKIHEVTERESIEIFEMRTAIEGYSALMLARNCQSSKAMETINKLKHNIEEQREIVLGSGDIEEFIEWDLKFHSLILEYSGNKIFLNNFNSSINIIRTLARISLRHEGRMPVGFKEHEDVYKAIVNGDINNIFELTERSMENPKSITLSDILAKDIIVHK